ncbi:WD40/YVTN/BNR-like repeat-containing protein [Chitinophaga varians]|uniref:WD40/YVTN/BNR-like repeat-containing protein n=1 Tax=Chitinophaga varians TaxID=2202339 RepID=UPI00165F5935|nr:hypothetical protein [Chitinophaga varians]MBC9913052.1 hypothetical protein [Chitinophaga varians]
MNRIMISLTLFLCCAAGPIRAQRSAPFPFQSNARTLNVSPQGSMAITTKGGELAYADSVRGLWRSAAPMNEGGSSSGQLLERTNLFNNDTAFTSGFINNKGKYDIIYRTENAGKTWTAVDFGQDGWIDATANLSNGEAWMSIAGKGVAHTADFGKTWEISLARQDQRYSTMFCNNKREGIMGAVWNSLLYSSNNGKNWVPLKTPLDQKKYDKTDPNKHPEFDDVAIFKNYFLVKQEGMVFITGKDSLAWKYVRNIESFYADPEHDVLYLCLKDKSILHVNERLDTVAVGKVEGPPFSGTCVNRNLYLHINNDVICISGNENIQRFPVLYLDTTTVTTAVEEPQTFGMSPDRKYYYGIAGEMIYKTKVEKEKWKPVRKLPVSLDVSTIRFNPQRNEIAFEMDDDSIYHLNIADGQTRVDRKGEYLSRFQQHPVSKITVSLGSYGCFHSYSDNLKYERDGNEFVLMDNSSKGTEHAKQMGSYVEVIPADDVSRLVKAVCNDHSRLPGIADLGFTKKEFDRCKKDIQTFRADRKTEDKFGGTSFYIGQNNVDFDKLISLVDSIGTLDSVAVGEILRNSNNFGSTTTDWMSVTLVNDNSAVLQIHYTYYQQPNAMRLPCALFFNDETLAAFTPEITRFLEKNCPSLMKDRNRMPLLYDMVKYLYAKKGE